MEGGSGVGRFGFRRFLPQASRRQLDGDGGAEAEDKRYQRRRYHHSRTLEEMLERRPEEVIRLAVKGMMPRNRLARKQITKLKVYAGEYHPHAAQKPREITLEA